MTTSLSSITQLNPPTQNAVCCSSSGTAAQRVQRPSGHSGAAAQRRSGYRGAAAQRHSGYSGHSHTATAADKHVAQGGAESHFRFELSECEQKQFNSMQLPEYAQKQNMYKSFRQQNGEIMQNIVFGMTKNGLIADVMCIVKLVWRLVLPGSLREGS